MDEIATLKAIPLFGGMDDQELAGLRAAMESQSFLSGQVIIHEGEEGRHFYIIQEGRVQYISTNARGEDILLDESGPGGFFGELSMLTGEPRLVRVKAAEAVRTLSLNRDQFHEFLLKHPHAGIDVLTAISHRLYTTDKLLRQSTSRNVNQEVEQKSTFGQRLADGFAAMMGSWNFIIIQSAILAVWVIWNTIAHAHNAHVLANLAPGTVPPGTDPDTINGAWFVWDAYPFVFLNLALSFQAAYAAPIIMMSQNRAADKDRLVAEIDHQVNVKAEIKTGQIMARLDELEQQMHTLHAEQLHHLRLHGAEGNGSGGGKERIEDRR